MRQPSELLAFLTAWLVLAAAACAQSPLPSWEPPAATHTPLFAPPRSGEMALGYEDGGPVGRVSRAEDRITRLPPVFEPPADRGGGADSQVGYEPLRTAMTCGVGSSPQPIVGRFGLLPPAPLEASPLPTEALACSPPHQEKGGEDFPEVEFHPPHTDPRACLVGCDDGDFSADAFYAPYDPCAERDVYHGKSLIPTQRPWVERGLPFYAAGPIPVSGTEWGATNLSQKKFYVYGDLRTAIAENGNVGPDKTILAKRLNLELDYWFTSTERLHGFVGPLQDGGNFTRIEEGRFESEFDLFNADTDTLFFEGDLGQILGGFKGEYAQYDLPFTVGLVPLLFQNGVWTQDAMIGGAVTLPAKNSARLDWSNFDVTFFAGLDRVSSGAFGFDEGAGHVLGAHTFVDVRGGYLEMGYGFADDGRGLGRSYHNLGVSYTRRYLNAVSNSVRVILNTGQDPVAGPQTADGVLLLVENTLITKNPYNVFPYMNFFIGLDRPQPLARAGAFGGVLFNTGILFQSDALTGYPTLDATGNNTMGVSLGLDLLAPDYNQQLIVEAAFLQTFGEDATRNALGDQVGVGVRWQKPLSTATLIRADAMAGWLDNSEDITGARVEYRWKF
ncbi:hypothetical protein Mal64_30130 [Pseudobythopirellula maris]|uniref:Alginate export domain-containing protein n=1 Tax=Pseudobythopirellula maris TaxID=2527991 RepID=A0A5C5ZJC4_9BACT|nr:hypothetical protein [Pseudobythopirellula maris]TWT87474.1 hypothetical protein Mal64_30130 [Pseudobythopirellula maris]